MIAQVYSLMLSLIQLVIIMLESIILISISIRILVLFLGLVYHLHYLFPTLADSLMNVLLILLISLEFVSFLSYVMLESVNVEQ